jgi:hypothetical protein
MASVFIIKVLALFKRFFINTLFTHKMLILTNFDGKMLFRVELLKADVTLEVFLTFK